MKKVVNLDNLNNYYEISLKHAVKEIEKHINNDKSYKFYQVSLEDKKEIDKIFNSHDINTVVHLAAQAGVRYSIENPYAYLQSNLIGFGNILEAVKDNKISNFIFASSSSVYGGNKKIPFDEKHNVDHQMVFCLKRTCRQI